MAELLLLLAASAYHLGHVFLRAGHVEQAAGVAMTAARALEPGLATATPEHLSAWGALHLTALIAVARQDDRVAVRQLLGEAWTTADRLGQDRNDFWTAFGPTNVALHEVSTAVELATRARSCAKVRRSTLRVSRRAYLAGAPRCSSTWRAATPSSARTPPP